MSRKFKIIALFISFNFGIGTIANKSFAQEATVSFQVFYDELSPYGQWINYPSYGYVWVPNVEAGFSPYATSGHWVLTEYGWTWVSDYSWGWAPFHYGRWNYDNSYGWLWMPQNEWGPAWVTWRQSEGYYGWAPMGYGISVEASLSNGYYGPRDHWRFVKDGDINKPNINNYYIDRSRNETIINNSTVIRNTHVDNGRHTTYVAGPGREDVQKFVGAPIQPVTIRGNNKPGQNLRNGELEIYRPQIQETNANGQRTAPGRVTKMEELKPSPQRNVENKKENPGAPKNADTKEQQVQPGKVRNGNDSKPVQERKLQNKRQPASNSNNNNTRTSPMRTNQEVPQRAPEKRSERELQPNQVPQQTRPEQNTQPQNARPPANQPAPQRQPGNRMNPKIN